MWAQFYMVREGGGMGQRVQQISKVISFNPKTFLLETSGLSLCQPSRLSITLDLAPSGKLPWRSCLHSLPAQPHQLAFCPLPGYVALPPHGGCRW